MKFNSKAGQELRTWILFIVGILIAIIFALNGNPLSPWWTLIIGAFTCTAVIVSAVQALAGGISDVTRKAIEEIQNREDGRHDLGGSTKESPPSALPFVVGPRIFGLILPLRRRNSVAIQ